MKFGYSMQENNTAGQNSEEQSKQWGVVRPGGVGFETV